MRKNYRSISGRKVISDMNQSSCRIQTMTQVVDRKKVPAHGLETHREEMNDRGISAKQREED